MTENPMKQIKVAKVTVNISEGQVGEDVEKATKLVKKLTGKEPVKVQSGEDSKSFGLRPGLKIGAKATLREEEAEEFIKDVAPAVEQINKSNFDGNGNFAFGISEYIDIPGIDYDADIGMKGLEIMVTLERPGYRVKRRDHKPSQIGKDHKISDEEAIEYVQSTLGLEVTQ